MGSPIESLKGVGENRATHLRALGLESLNDLLEYFPRTYRHELAEGSIGALQPDQIQTVRGTVVACDYIPIRPRPRFEATLDDGSGKVALSWFNAAYLRRKITPGLVIRVRGKVTLFRNFPRMTNPKWEPIGEDEPTTTDESFRPVYPATADLPSDAIAKIVNENLDAITENIREWFTPEVLTRHELLGRREAYRKIHCPANLEEAAAARKRLVYDELMLLQLGLAMSKRLRAGRISAPLMRIDKHVDERILSRFPFELTEAQRRVVHEIVNDLRSGLPMNRLLQGDVGSGKTAVALYAMLLAVANKMQAAVLAPTEVLAEQHFMTLSNFLKDSSVRVGLFTHRAKKRGGDAQLEALSEGQIHLAVGTQALLGKDVRFANLGLVVVDEQHRLGVQQRSVLKQKGYSPHYLVMTATPIPRTLALSYFADFDYSVIDALPPGRQPIRTKLIKSSNVSQAHDFIWQEIGKGRQAYIVVPMIEGDATDDAKSVKSEFEKLAKGPLNGLRLAMLHGQLKAEEKQSVMAAFRERQIDVLVATTVIEVGIDVPNATIMLIENADRFGLSQLHQLRGRVGRGSELSHCLLISDLPNEGAKERLTAMTQSNSGFDIAEMDLKLRGPGEFFGTRQHGLPELKLADITTEIDMLHTAREDALAILETDPRLTNAENHELRNELQRRFGETLELAQVG